MYEIKSMVFQRWLVRLFAMRLQKIPPFTAHVDPDGKRYRLPLPFKLTI
jgi:hypothetical protein